ncbi:MAG: hypothetical protein N2Z82_04690 [Thermomicrobium sp.]|nr:hypothetical protein [Thermomicrobium sp.]
MERDLWLWLSLVALGLFHGINPAMGWLFAVALGLQEGRLSAVLQALLPIGLGHAAAVGLAALAAVLLGTTLPQPVVLLIAGTLLLGFTAWRIWRRFRHPRTRFRASARELAVWSFLMASAHGAGLMVAPLVAVLAPHAAAAAGHAAHVATRSVALAVLAAALHTLAMFAAMTVVAVVVYREIGVEILRRAWFNVDLVWIVVLALAGGVTLAAGVYGLL